MGGASKGTGCHQAEKVAKGLRAPEGKRRAGLPSGLGRDEGAGTERSLGLATRWMDSGRGSLRIRPSFQQLRLGEGEARLLSSCLDHHPPPLRAQEGQRQPRVQGRPVYSKGAGALWLTGLTPMSDFRAVWGRTGGGFGQELSSNTGVAPGVASCTATPPKLGGDGTGHGACPEAALIRDRKPPSSGPSENPGPGLVNPHTTEGKDGAQGNLLTATSGLPSFT